MKEVQEIIVKAIRKSFHKSSDDIAAQIIKDLFTNGYSIAPIDLSNNPNYVKVC